MEEVKTIRNFENNRHNLAAWILLAGCSSALLCYGLSFIVSAPTVETITVNPANTIADDQFLHDANFHQTTKKLRYRRANKK